MNTKLTIFTSITPSFSDSSELQLCMDMLHNSLSSAKWIVHTPDISTLFKQWVEENIPDEGYVLFIKTPAILIGKETYSLLKKHLQKNSDILAVLPSDTRNTDNIPAPNYHTLRGFEDYSNAKSHHNSHLIHYDGRDPWLFLISAQTLITLKLPDNPFDLPLSLSTDQVAIAQDAYSHPFLNYYNETRAEILPFVPRHINSLLDVGCSQGGFGALVKESLNCRVAGIEMNPYEAKSAQKVLDQLWVGNALSLNISEQFDCISCLDVLEHIPEPQKLLNKIKHWLTPDGKILLNVPNVGFWAIVEDLLAGRWDYVPAGILCNTHLRFYTQYSLRQLLKECGLKVITLESHQVPVPKHIRAGFENYQNTGLTVDYENLSTVSFTVLAEPCQ